MDMRGHAAIVTGGASGLGAATAHMLAEAGAKVAIFDVNQNSVLALAFPDALRSRLVGAYRFVNYGTRPVGALLGGVLGGAIGLRQTLWISVAGSSLGVVFLLFSPMPGIREEHLA